MKNNNKPTWFSPQDESDEETPSNGKLDAELDMPDISPASSAEHEKEEEEEVEELPEPSRLWREARHLEIEKSEVPADLGVEIPLEQLEEQEVIDDSVRMYLHEIGRVHLLTADDEKVLARKMEEGRRISEIKQDWVQKYGKPPSATEIVLTMLKELSRNSAIIHLVQKELGLTPTSSFVQTISGTAFRDSIDGEIDQQLIQAVAYHTDKTIPGAEHLLINLSINSNLLPQEVLNVIGDSPSPADIENLAANTTFIDSIQDYENQLEAYWIILSVRLIRQESISLKPICAW